MAGYSKQGYDMYRVGDLLAQTQVYGKTTINELSQSLGTVTPFSSQVGMSLEDLSTIMAVLTSNGLDTAIATVGLKNALTSILSPTSSAVKQFEKFNGGSKFRNGDTIMARITPCLENGKTAFVDFLDNNEVAFGSTEFIVARAKENVSLPLFVYYLLCSNPVREVAILSMTGSSGRERVQQFMLDNYEISNYSLAFQQHIVDIRGNMYAY